jgi:hypothetical protein
MAKMPPAVGELGDESDFLTQVLAQGMQGIVDETLRPFAGGIGLARQGASQRVEDDRRGRAHGFSFAAKGHRYPRMGSIERPWTPGRSPASTA